MDAKHTTVITSDTPVEVNVNTDSTGRWFRVFRATVSTGVWAELSPSAAKVLLVLASHVNDSTRNSSGAWIAWPSVNTIGREAGVGRRSVLYAIGELEQRHLLVRRVAGGGRGTNTYQLTEPKGVQQRAPVQQSAPHPCKGVHRRGAAACTQQRENDRERMTAAERTGAAAGDELVEALIDAGISDPTRSKLAQLEGVTPKMVKDIATQARERGKGAGVIVQDIRTAAEKAVRRRRRQAERQATEDAQRREQAAEAARIDAEQQALDEFIAQLDADELEHHRSNVLDAADLHTRRLIGDVKPTSSSVAGRTLAQMIHESVTGGTNC